MGTYEILTTALNKVVVEENIENPIILYNTSGETGFIAEVATVKIKGENKEINIFIKQKPVEINKTNEINEGLFNGEKHFYNSVLPALRNFEESRGVSCPLQCIPKCFYADENVILLEDMHARGYEIWEPLCEALDHDHIVSVCKEYGRFHALSMAFRKHQPELFSELLTDFEDPVLFMAKYIASDFFSDCAKKAAGGFAAGESKYVDAFYSICNRERILEDFEKFPGDIQYNVLVHGDCWSHNYIFKKDTNVQICMLDFQISRQSTPIVDLSYFFCTSGCTKEVFDNMPTYLQIYYDSLTDYLKELGIESEELYPYELFMQQWKKYGTYGLYWGIWVNKMMVATKEELEEHRSNTGFFYGFNFISKNERMYQQKMRDAIVYFYDNNMFSNE